MTAFRFLHCADLHIDSPLRGLEADPDAPAEAIRGATRRAFINLVDYAIAEHVDFVVAAGDLYDGDWQDWRTGHFLHGQVGRLTRESIPFFAIRGNHDAESVITKRLELPGVLDYRRPETIRMANLPVSIHGQSFGTKAVTENIARHYPPPDPGRFNIGLLHTAIDGNDNHPHYAPCSIDQLRAHGYEYWALGHVHKREILSRDPWIVFPGNLQGRHINEPGAKGGMLVVVEDGAVAEVRPLRFDTVHWARIPIQLDADDGEEEALAAVRAALMANLEEAEGRLLAVRLRLSGACQAHESFSRDPAAARERVRTEALNIGGPGLIWTETVEFATHPLTAAGTRSDAIGRLIGALEDIDMADIESEVQAFANAMLEKVPSLRQAVEHTGAGDMRDLLRRARNLLLGSLED